jgi:glycosyl transferase family 25
VSGPVVFVINLDRDGERLARMRARLDACGVAFERFPATLGTALSEAELRPLAPEQDYWLQRRAFTRGELGCTLSHWGALKEIVARGLPYAVIMEDDVHVDQDFAEVLAALPALAPRYDLIKLEGLPWMGPYYFRELAVHGSRRLCLPRYPAVGAAAYFVTQKAARRLVQAIVPVREPVDHTVVDYSLHGYTFAELFPYPARQGEDVSANEQERRDLPRFKPTGAYKWRKRGHKFARRWRQRLYELQHLGVWTLWTPQEKTTRPRKEADNLAA